MNEYKDKHQYGHNKQQELNGTDDYIYICVCREDLYHVMAVYADMFYWDDKRKVFIKQELIKCSCCNTEFRKYPDVEKFEKIKEFNEKLA